MWAYFCIVLFPPHPSHASLSCHSLPLCFFSLPLPFFLPSFHLPFLSLSSFILLSLLPLILPALPFPPISFKDMETWAPLMWVWMPGKAHGSRPVDTENSLCSMWPKDAATWAQCQCPPKFQVHIRIHPKVWPALCSSKVTGVFLSKYHRYSSSPAFEQHLTQSIARTFIKYSACGLGYLPLSLWPHHPLFLHLVWWFLWVLFAFYCWSPRRW